MVAVCCSWFKAGLIVAVFQTNNRNTGLGSGGLGLSPPSAAGAVLVFVRSWCSNPTTRISSVYIFASPPSIPLSALLSTQMSRQKDGVTHYSFSANWDRPGRADSEDSPRRLDSAEESLSRYESRVQIWFPSSTWGDYTSSRSTKLRRCCAARCTYSWHDGNFRPAHLKHSLNT